LSRPEQEGVPYLVERKGKPAASWAKEKKRKKKRRIALWHQPGEKERVHSPPKRPRKGTRATLRARGKRGDRGHRRRILSLQERGKKPRSQKGRCEQASSYGEKKDRGKEPRSRSAGKKNVVIPAIHCGWEKEEGKSPRKKADPASSRKDGRRVDVS